VGFGRETDILDSDGNKITDNSLQMLNMPYVPIRNNYRPDKANAFVKQICMLVDFDYMNKTSYFVLIRFMRHWSYWHWRWWHLSWV